MRRLTRGRSSFAARRSMYWTQSPATFPPRKSASASTATNRFTGLCRRAWRNTLQNRLFTRDSEKGFAATRTSRGHRRGAGKAGGGDHAARFSGARRVYRRLSALHGLQLAAGGGHLRRDRTATRADRHALEAPRRHGRRRMDVARFRRLHRARLHRASAALLRPRAPLARRATCLFHWARRGGL